jgi:hypothetical protein
MSDNGAAMTATEIAEGLVRLGVLHETTLPYSPYINVASGDMCRPPSEGHELGGP